MTDIQFLLRSKLSEIFAEGGGAAHKTNSHEGYNKATSCDQGMQTVLKMHNSHRIDHNGSKIFRLGDNDQLRGYSVDHQCVKETFPCETIQVNAFSMMAT